MGIPRAEACTVLPRPAPFPYPLGKPRGLIQHGRLL